MTYEIGQKILVEATVVGPNIDRDGDIRLCFRENPDDWDWVSAAKTREIPVEPKLIAFGDIEVGDKIRASDTAVRDGYTSHYVFDGITVEKVFSGEVVGSGGVTFRSYMSYTYELISRPEPEPIKVGDKINSDQVKTLPVCSVVTFPKDDSEFRTVSVNGLYDADFDTTRGWAIYDGLAGFTVKYVAEQA